MNTFFLTLTVAICKLSKCFPLYRLAVIWSQLVACIQKMLLMHPTKKLGACFRFALSYITDALYRSRRANQETELRITLVCDMQNALKPISKTDIQIVQIISKWNTRGTKTLANNETAHDVTRGYPSNHNEEGPYELQRTRGGIIWIF